MKLVLPKRLTVKTTTETDKEPTKLYEASAVLHILATHTGN